MMKNNLFYFAIICILPSTIMSQSLDKQSLDKNSLIFKFEETSNLEYSKKGEMDKIYREKTYIENEDKNGNFDFFIEGLLFRHDKTKMQSKVIKKSDFPCIELLFPKQVKDHINDIKEKYPLGYNYPSKKYPTIYIAKEKNDSIILYKVQWKYYTE